MLRHHILLYVESPKDLVGKRKKKLSLNSRRNCRIKVDIQESISFFYISKEIDVETKIHNHIITVKKHLAMNLVKC